MKRRGSRFRRNGSTFDDRKRAYWLECGQEKKMSDGNSRNKLNTREAMGTSTDSITGDGEEIEQHATSLDNIEGFAGTHEEMQRMIDKDEVARANAQIAENGLEGMVIIELRELRRINRPNAE